MITRKEYMNNSSVLHNEYYSQFVTPFIISYVKASFGEKRIKASTDPYFNDIPLYLWDNMVSFVLSESKTKRKEINEGNSISTGVCIAKAAARIIKEAK